MSEKSAYNAYADRLRGKDAHADVPYEKLSPTEKAGFQALVEFVRVSVINSDEVNELKRDAHREGYNEAMSTVSTKFREMREKRKAAAAMGAGGGN